MYVTSLGTDCWIGIDDHSTEIAHPFWTDIEEAIRRLDGKFRTIVSVSGSGKAHMVVGGGSRDRYVVYLTFDNESFKTLMSDGDSTVKELLFIGGQDGDYPKSIIVNLQSALKAARVFSESGMIDPTQKWRDY